MEDLARDLSSSLVIHDEDVLVAEAWELSEAFLRKWWCVFLSSPFLLFSARNGGVHANDERPSGTSSTRKYSTSRTAGDKNAANQP